MVRTIRSSHQSWSWPQASPGASPRPFESRGWARPSSPGPDGSVIEPPRRALAARAVGLALARAEAGAPQQALGLGAAERSGVHGGAHPSTVIGRWGARLYPSRGGYRPPCDGDPLCRSPQPGEEAGRARARPHGLPGRKRALRGRRPHPDRDSALRAGARARVRAGRARAAPGRAGGRSGGRRAARPVGGFAVGVFDGERLVDSKVGTRFVKGRHKKGGSSANRFRRRREGQERELVEVAAADAARVLAPWQGRVEHVALGGDRDAVRRVLANRAELTWLEPLALDASSPSRTRAGACWTSCRTSSTRRGWWRSRPRARRV